jgi:hypothetical protein
MKEEEGGDPQWAEGGKLLRGVGNAHHHREAREGDNNDDMGHSITEQ